MNLKNLLATNLAIGLVSTCVQANNLSVIDGGLGVYDSITDITWTSDANLLGTLESQQGFTTVVNAIIASSPIIQDIPNIDDNGGSGSYSGIYDISAADFGAGGLVDWWGAQAFVNYLNYANYGHSNQWALPTTPDSNASFGNSQTSSQLGELIYNELGGTEGSPIPRSPYFFHEQLNAYWFGTEYSPSPYYAWYFDTNNSYQIIDYKNAQYYAWAVSPGEASFLPVPSAVWLFGSGVLGIFGLKRRQGRHDADSFFLG